MSDALVCDGPVTVRLLEQILVAYYKTNARLESCRGEVISRGLGFTSDVMRVELKWSNVENGAILPEAVIAKAPKSQHLVEIMKYFTPNADQETLIGEFVGANPDQMIKLIHDAECNAYKVLLMDSAGPPVPLPLIYCCRMEEPRVIVMEDMSQRAGCLDDLVQGLNLRQWQSVADCLADLHAWSLTTDVPWRQYVGGMDTLTKIFNNWISVMFNALKTTKEKYAEFAEVDLTLYDREFKIDRLMNNQEKYRQILPDVMQHGDTWTNNLFFKKDEYGRIGDQVAAFIDWQISFAGCGLSDLARISFMCVNQRLRRMMAPQIVKRYFTRFITKAGLFDDRISFERVWKIFQHMSAINGLMSLLMTDFLLRFIIKAENRDDPRCVEMISRLKAGYEESADFLRQPDYDKF